MLRLGGAYVFGYNSAKYEPIWMKFGALSIVRGWLWQFLGTICHSWRPRQNFFVSKQCMISPIFHRPDLTKFEHNTSIGVTMNTFRTELLKFYCRRSIFWKMLKWLQISGKSLPTAQCIPLGQLPSASWYKYQSSSGWRRPRPLIAMLLLTLS